jgi:RNA polymerase sigma factor (sigma-70 family)
MTLARASDLSSAYAAHRAEVERFVARRTANQNDAEDVAQEVFARIAAASPVRVVSWRAMLFRVARSVLIDHARRARARLGSAHAGLDSDLVEDARPNQHEEAVSADALLELREQLMALDPIVRQIIILVRIEGLSHREVAERLGLEPVIVSRQLAQGLARLARKMAGHL